MEIPISLVGLLLTALCVLSDNYESPCMSSTSNPAGIRFSIVSKRNRTGHWNSQVHLKQGSGLTNGDHKETGAVIAEVIQTSENCGEWEAVDVAVAITAPPKRAGPRYELVPGLGYYKFHTTPKIWQEAREKCYDEGAHLAIINSETELKALQVLFKLHPTIQDGWQNNDAHVGFHDMFVEGQYVTIFGDSLESTGYSKFAQGEPTGNLSDCGCIHRTASGLNDVGCLNQLSFFCEQELY